MTTEDTLTRKAPAEIPVVPEEPGSPARVLFVDDEVSVLNALRRVFRNFEDYEYDFAQNPKEAIETISRNEYAVLVCDHKMPQMTGAEFLARIKDKRPSMIRMMLTGQADLEAVTRAVNDGEIFRFMLKPWNDDDLRMAVKTGVEHHRLAEENRRLQAVTQAQNKRLTDLTGHLEEQVRERNLHLSDALHTAQELSKSLQQSLYAVANSFFALVELAKPDLGTHCRRVALHASALAARVGYKRNDLKEVEIAALLHDCGKLGFPQFMLEKAVEDLRPKELRLYESHPEVAVEHLRQLKGYENIAEFILCHHELYDGAGFPNGRKSSKIPMQAFIIALMDQYDLLIQRPGPDPHFVHQATIQALREMANRKYPEQLVNEAIDYIVSIYQQSNDEGTLKIGLANVAPGMTLAADLYTLGGTLLLASGQLLTQQNIRRVRSIAVVDPILGEVQVYPKRR